jgi:hypothetical protein
MFSLRPGRRTFAILAILLLLAVAGSDFLIAGFWVSHPMLTAIVSALVVALLSVAVIEVVLSRRSERRWRILAQSALIELGEAANTTWSALAEGLDLRGASEMSPDQVRATLAPDATSPIVRRLQFLREGHKQIDERELRGRGRREYSSPGGEAEDEWFVDNFIGTINIGATLEDATWDLALRLLPQAWWDRRTAELAAAARTRRPTPAAER